MQATTFIVPIMAVLLVLGCTGSDGTPASTKAVSPQPAGGQAPPEIDRDGAKLLFETKCSLCHALDRPASKKMDYEGWLDTVHRMQYNGAPVDDGEAEIIAAYLAWRYGP